MAIREDRIAEAQKHIGLVKGILASETSNTIEGAKLYEDGEKRDRPTAEPRFEKTEITVERVDAVYAICKAKGKACVLDFASYRYPGGGYERGAWAQEEALCAESNLYPILDGLKSMYYEPNRKSICGELYTDRALYLSDVVFLHGGNMLKRDVIVCAAPNRSRALENHRSQAECDLCMRNRVFQVMGIAVDNNVDTLVLGAFGCGVFGNDSSKVARYFEEWLSENPGMFETVVFAIPGGPNSDAFKSVFGKSHDEIEQKPISAHDDPQEDEDEEDWLPPSEDGRWVFD